MIIDSNIRIFKGFPDDDIPEGYLPIDSTLVRSGDVIYLDINIPNGYGVARIEVNGETQPLTPRFIDGRYMYRVIVENCNDNYRVVLGRNPDLLINVTQDDTYTYEAIFTL